MNFVTRTLKSVADILADSREYIEEHGWTQLSYRNRDTGEVCSLGGIICSQGWWGVHMSPEETKRYEEVRRALARVINKNDIPGWNDTPMRSKQEVLDAFAKAEKIERAGFDPDA